MASLFYLIGGLSDVFGKSSQLIEAAHNSIESALIKDQLLGVDDSIVVHGYPHRWRRDHGAIPPESEQVQEQAQVKPRYIGSHRHSGIPLFGGMRADELAADLCDELRRLMLSGYDSLVVVCYSGGTAIFRAALAKEIKDRCSVDDRSNINERSWITSVKKIIHVGGMTLGWQFNSEMNKLLLWTGPLVRTIPWIGNRLFPFQIYRGSKFIVDTRIALTKAKYDESKSCSWSIPEPTYILGTRDQYISPADAIEPGFSSTSSKQSSWRCESESTTTDQPREPLYLEMKHSTHQSIINNPSVIEFLKQEWEHVKSGEALNTSKPTSSLLQKIAASDLDDYLDPLDNLSPETDKGVENVVIILHGIRDNGYWAKRIAHRIKDQWRKNCCKENDLEKSDPSTIDHTVRDMRVVTLSYGYFSLWDFIRPGGRRRAVEWFQNAYADIVALYPRAKISFIGHSNGTYLGLEALKCTQIRFKSVLLAGSVVRRDFWTKNSSLLAPAGDSDDPKVSKVLNVVAMEDWIVGLLPGGFETIPFIGKAINLGGAGAYGFKLDERATKGEGSIVEQIKIKGGHGAGISEVEWDKIAGFICKVHGKDDYKVHRSDVQADTIGKMIGMPHKIQNPKCNTREVGDQEEVNQNGGDQKGDDQGLALINTSMKAARYITGLALLVAFGLYLLPYLYAIGGLLLSIPRITGAAPLPVAQPGSYAIFLVLLLISALARSLLKSI